MFQRIILFVAIAFSAAAQEASLSSKLDHASEAYQKNRRFIGAVLVAKGDKVIHEKGYGLANMEWNIPNSPITKFRLGSITKQFTATAILQLQEQGKLKVTDLACKYVDDCPDKWKAVTIHQLLSHTSGIPSYTEIPGFFSPKTARIPLSPVEIVMLTKDKPMEFQPGEGWKYDNSGYVFLGAIIEKASGEKYADYLQKHIFAPLDMNDSGYDVTSKILPNRASGYEPSGPAGFKNADYLDMSLPHAAGSLYSTARDLYRWDRALYTDKVLSKESREKMFTAVSRNYAYGWTVAPLFNHKQIGHGGGINGFSTQISRFPDDDAVVIVLSNNMAGNPGALARDLAATLFGEKVTLPGEEKIVPVDSKVLDRHVGTYDVGPMKITVTNETGHLMIQPTNQPKFEALPLSDTQFTVRQVGATLNFVVGPDGRATELKLTQGGQTLSGKRIN